MAFTDYELKNMSGEAPKWHKAHMAEAVRRALEIEKVKSLLTKSKKDAATTGGTLS
jgi:hypothetical protein